jgi:hypothetical protein
MKHIYQFVGGGDDHTKLSAGHALDADFVRLSLDGRAYNFKRLLMIDDFDYPKNRLLK